MEIKINIDDQRIADTLVNAFEGGSNYWYRINNSHARHRDLRHVTADGEKKYLSDVPLLPGGNLVIEQADEDDYIPCPCDLNRDTIAAGLLIMAAKYTKHFADLVSENDDAETADVMLQCIVLGDVVYG